MYSIHEKLIRVDILALCAAHPCLATVTHLASAVVAPWVVFVAWIFFFCPPCACPGATLYWATASTCRCPAHLACHFSRVCMLGMEACFRTWQQHWGSYPTNRCESEEEGSFCINDAWVVWWRLSRLQEGGRDYCRLSTCDKVNSLQLTWKVTCLFKKSLWTNVYSAFII